MTRKDAGRRNSTDVTGWNSITAALARVYPQQRPCHYAPMLADQLGAEQYLEGISAYLSTAGHPHWHFVTYGFSELYRKVSKDPTTSGFGFELTFRCTDRSGGASPPEWPLSFLQNVAHYVFSTGNVFREGHHMSLNCPIAATEATAIDSIVLVLDPELGAIETPHGTVRFLQAVGLTGAEYELAKRWNAGSFVELLQRTNPLLITDLHRPCASSSPDVLLAVEEGIARDGSSEAEVYAGVAAWEKLAANKIHVRLEAGVVEDVVRAMTARLAHDRPFYVTGPLQVIQFRPGDKSQASVKRGALVLTLSPTTAAELAAALLPEPRVYAVESFPRLTVEVVPPPPPDSRNAPAQYPDMPDMSD